ncbi:MAG: AAA family ATPase, partial [Aldersonia sp.]|nr:AAA family ATPase [Aldersonia sp.]
LAQQTVYDVTERRVSEDFAVLAEMLQPTLDEIEAVGAQGGLMTGVPTGFTDLDRLLNGLHGGQLIIVAGRPGLGKARALDTLLPTPTGWTTMGEVAVGDHLIGADGRPITVVATSEVMLGRPCYEVEFCDGAVIVADGSHQWLTESRASWRSGSPRTFTAVHTTEELAASLDCPTPDGQPNHTVTNCAPLHLPEPSLPVPPYTLGVRLGHGNGDAVDGDHGALGDKHVPAAYLRASSAQRRALLAGLLDTGGTVNRAGSVRFITTDERLASDVHELIVSLGYRCSTERSPTVSTITFTTCDDVFRLQHKQLMHEQRRPDSGTVGTSSRFVVDVRRVPSVPMRCVQVDSEDHLYLAGRSMIPTHNSTLGLDFARSCSIRHGLTSLIFSLEMSRTEIVMRLLSAEAGIPLADMRTGRMNDDKWAKLARKMSEISEAPLFIDDSPNMTMMEIRAKARRLKHRHGLRLLVVDYMQLMTSGKRVESRQQEVSEFSRHLKLLAKELEVPVVTISQLNRGPEQRTDKKPMLGDLRESGSLEQDADVVLLIHRPDAFERDDPRAG